MAPARLLRRVALLVVVLVSVFAPTMARAAPGPDPTIRVEQKIGAAGPVTMVVVESWPFGPASVSICGNEGLRGSADCDQTGTRNVIVPGSQTFATPLPPLKPPIGCPCVIRVAAKSETLVRTEPIDIPGVPVLRPEERPPRPFTVPPAAQLSASAMLENRSSITDSLTAGFGASARRLLVVSLRNNGDTPMADLTWTVSVGAPGGAGAPVAMPVIGPFAPHEERTVEVVVELPSATFGALVVSGQIKGLDAPVRFDAETRHTPWVLVFVPVVVLVVGVVLIVRRRRGRTTDAANGEPVVLAPSRVVSFSRSDL